jgi:hypothetical protein
MARKCKGEEIKKRNVFFLPYPPFCIQRLIREQKLKGKNVLFKGG